MSLAFHLAENGYLPDSMLRSGIRKLCRDRLAKEGIDQPELAEARYQELLGELRASPLAIATDQANEQHYELPTEFFKTVLGPRLKYSSCFYSDDNNTLEQAEIAALQQSCERAQLADGQHILELGCGWGSLTLWMAEHYPNAKITAVSNSKTQKLYIDAEAARRGFDHIHVITCDVNQLSLEANQFDRAVSIEMFEHVRNYQQLFANISTWLKPEGKLWCHIFTHRFLMYSFGDENEQNWMSKYFFTGGMMPSSDTFLNFQDDLSVEQRWLWSGQHYEKTANHWLDNMDANKDNLMPLFDEVYGKDASIWWQRWRLFFMSCAELFGLEKGCQWGVNHYRFTNRKTL